MSKRCTDTSRFPKLFCILIIFAMSQLSLSLSAETESDSDNKTLLWPDGTRYVGGVKDGSALAKARYFGKMEHGLSVTLPMTSVMGLAQ